MDIVKAQGRHADTTVLHLPKKCCNYKKFKKFSANREQIEKLSYHSESNAILCS
jgi:hypothetical protein